MKWNFYFGCVLSAFSCLLLGFITAVAAADDVPLAQELPVATAEAPPAKEVEHNYRWCPCNNPDQVALFDGPKAPNGIQLGVWVYSEKAWHAYHPDHDSWGEGKALPKSFPKPPDKPKPAGRNNAGHNLDMPIPDSLRGALPVRRGRSC